MNLYSVEFFGLAFSMEWILVYAAIGFGFSIVHAVCLQNPHRHSMVSLGPRPLLRYLAMWVIAWPLTAFLMVSDLKRQ